MFSWEQGTKTLIYDLFVFFAIYFKVHFFAFHFHSLLQIFELLNWFCCISVDYFHQEKGNCPLHVAAQSGQPLQVELLVVYGADPGAYDSNGKTPIDHAK